MLNATDTSETMERLAQLDSTMLTVRPGRCVCVRNRHASCTRCSDACTSGAIAMVDKTLQVSQDICVGCGTCATVCPTCALEIRYPNDAALLSRARAYARLAGSEVVFACHRAQVSDMDVEPVEVVCLSRLEETLLTTLFSEGVKHISALRADCQNCPRRDGLTSAELVQDTLKVLQRVWDIDATFDVVEVAPRDEAELAISAAHTARPKAEDTDDTLLQLAHVSADGTLPHFVPARRGKLLDVLSVFGDPVEEELETRLWGHIEIDMSACRSCRMCAVFCPTGALCKYDDGDGNIGIEHYVAECVHCLLCQDICPAGAIVSHANVPAMQLAHQQVERYPMPEPEWKSGPDQIVRRMEKKISGNGVTASYSTEMGKSDAR